MFKETNHPKAFLSLRRNVRLGLVARTQIVLQLEVGASSANEMAQNTKMSPEAVRHHLHLLEAENILARTGRRPCLWRLTGAGQQRLTNSPNKR